MGSSIGKSHSERPKAAREKEQSRKKVQVARRDSQEERTGRDRTDAPRPYDESSSARSRRYEDGADKRQNKPVQVTLDMFVHYTSLVHDYKARRPVSWRDNSSHKTDTALTIAKKAKSDSGWTFSELLNITDPSVCKSANLESSSGGELPELRFRLKKLRAFMFGNGLHIEEHANAITYTSDCFIFHADVTVDPIAITGKWKVGFIQACYFMHCENQYGNAGSTFWEFHELKSGRQKMVCDSDGTHYPWYGGGREMADFSGPSSESRTLSLQMRDCFYPCISLHIESHALTRVYRLQKFYAWLACLDVATRKIFVLKTVKWKYELEIAVDASNAAGQRCKVLRNNSGSLLPKFVSNIPIPEECLRPPNANSCQCLIWRPLDCAKLPCLIVPPKLHAFPWTVWQREMLGQALQCNPSNPNPNPNANANVNANANANANAKVVPQTCT